MKISVCSRFSCFFDLWENLYDQPSTPNTVDTNSNFIVSDWRKPNKVMKEWMLNSIMSLLFSNDRDCRSKNARNKVSTVSTANTQSIPRDKNIRTNRRHLCTQFRNQDIYSNLSVSCGSGRREMNQILGIPAAIVDKFRPHFTELLSKIVEHSGKFRQNCGRNSGIWISRKAR